MTRPRGTSFDRLLVEPGAPPDPQPRLHRLVLLAVLHRGPEEHGADDCGGQEQQNINEDRRRNGHLEIVPGQSRLYASRFGRSASIAGFQKAVRGLRRHDRVLPSLDGD